MSEKTHYIPYISNYDYIRDEMQKDLEWRLKNKTVKIAYGRPLYNNINIQIITTHECPFECSFCIERKNPMCGKADFAAQAASLYNVLMQHPTARVSVTGGEPLLYPYHINKLYEIYLHNSKQNFFVVNTTGYDAVKAEKIPSSIPFNVSVNDSTQYDERIFSYPRRLTLQTIVKDEDMRLSYLRNWIRQKEVEIQVDDCEYSFRFLSWLDRKDYSVDIWNDLRRDPKIRIDSFRIGDFFVYCNYFDYELNRTCRVTLGDMYQQRLNLEKYGDGYSNIIIHPDGKIGVNWQ